MKIAITGTHNVGKTSLAHSLVGAIKEMGIHAVVGAETVRMCPLPTGTESSNSLDASFWILGKQFIDEVELTKKYPIVVCDRSMICIYAYFLWNLEQEPNRKGEPGVQIMHKMVDEWIKTYDYIFRLPVSEQTRLSKDGFRSITENWQRDIDKLIDKIIAEKGVKTYTIPLESNARRVQKILEVIKPDLENLE